MPEAVAAAVVSFFQLTGPVAAVASAAVQVAVIAGANAIVSNNSKEKAQGGLIDLQLSSSAPRSLIIGKRMVGGILVDWYLAGSNNTKLYLPTYLSEGPCGQVTRVFADGRQVWATPLVHGVRTAIPDFRSGGDRLWLTYYDGRVGQTADPTLVALGQGWTSANKMAGCAWVLVECQWDSDNMLSPPQLSFEMEGAKLYDRRKDTTAGGSGSHRLTNPATWEWTDNAAVALDHFMLGRYIGSVKTFGIGLTSDEVPYDRFAAQANVCDEDVAKKAGGTQKRYRANGFLFANEDYASTITKLCTAMAARPADFGGRFGVVGVESRTPVMTIADDDLIAGTEEIYTPKRTWGDLVGAIEGRFQDPAQLYQPVDYPRVTDSAWEVEDGGEPKVMTLDLEFETDVERAQRIALLKARAERRQATLRGIYPLKTIELERGDWFIRTGPKWGGSGKTFEVLERILNPDTYTVSIVAQEADASDSAWDESTASDGPPAPLSSTSALSTVIAPALTVTSNPIVGANSNTPAIKVAFSNPTDPRVRNLFIEVTRTSDGLKVATETVNIPDADGEVILQNGIADDEDYGVQARYLTATIFSDWSDVEFVTTGATYAVGEADSVDWDNVNSRPLNLAALGGTEAINNALVPAGSNGLFDTSFKWFSSLWTMDASVGAATRSTEASTLGLAKGVATGSGVTANGANYIRHHSQSQRQYFPCKPGMVVGARALLGGVNVSSMNLRVVFRNAAGTLIGTGATIGSVSSGILDGTGEETTFNELTALGTAPAGTVCATIEARGIATTNAPVLRIAKPLLAVMSSGQTAIPEFAPGREFEPGANVTETRVSVAIASQGAFATLSSAAYGSALLTGFGTLAALSNALGLTAGSITGQGWGATASANQASNDFVPLQGFNRNPTYQAWASTLPDNYSASGSPTVAKNTTNKIYGAHVLDITATAIADVWLFASASAELRLPQASTYYTIEWEVELVSGNFAKAGILYRTLLPDASNYRDFAVSFETEHGVSPAVGRYSGTKTLASNGSSGSPTGLPTGSQLFNMMNWANLAGSAVSAKQIRWHRLNVRPATQQEIAATLGLQLTGKLSSIAGIFGDDIKESAGVVATAANFKTILGVAAGFTGQGWGATASELQSSNALVPIAGFNRNPTFQDWTSTLPANWTNQGSLTVVKDTTNQIYGAHCIDITAAATANGYLNNGSVNELRLPALTSYVVFDWEIDLVSGDFKRAGLEYRFLRPDASNINRFMLSFETEHGTAPAAGRYSGSRVVPITTTVGSPTGNPTDTAFRLGMNLNGLVGSADSAKRIRWHRASVRPASQQEIAASLGLQATGKLSAIAGIFGDDLKESAGVVASLANFKTASGTAGGIVGQGGLATLSFVTIATNLRLADGTTVATTAMVVTASGVAGAIAGQGGLATKNMYYQSTDPGGANGELWGDTTANKLKYKNSGAWVVIADISPTVVEQLSVSASGNFIKNKSGTGTQTNTSNNVTFTPAGGAGSYTYTAELAGNTNTGISVSLSATSGSGSTFVINITATTIAPAETRGTVIVTVTDSAGKSVQFTKGYTLTWDGI